MGSEPHLDVEVDQLLGDVRPLCGVGGEQLRRGSSGYYVSQLPAQVPGVHDRGI